MGIESEYIIDQIKSAYIISQIERAYIGIFYKFIKKVSNSNPNKDNIGIQKQFFLDPIKYSPSKSRNV